MPLPIQSLLREETIVGPLLLVEFTARKTRTGSDYLDLKFKDATGTVSGKMWQSSPELLAHIQVPGPVRIAARVDEFQNRPQLIVERLEAYEPSDEEYAGLIATSAWGADLLWEEIRTHLRHQIQDEALWTLVDAVLNDPEVSRLARTQPAASHNHHAYRSGLAEHMLSMMRLSAKILEHYEHYYNAPVHRGLVAAGVLLHDIGKIWELSGELNTEYTTEGRLLGHIFMAASWIDQLGQKLGTPRNLITELQHLILSHHGQLEFGSPKVPQTIEAMLLHHVDKLDSDMNQWMNAIAEPGWSEYQRNYGRSIFRADEFRQEWSEPYVAGDNLRGPGKPVDLATEVAPQAQASAASERPAKKEVPAPESHTLTLFDGLND